MHRLGKAVFCYSSGESEHAWTAECMQSDFQYIILPEQRFIAQRFRGTVALMDVIAATETMWDDPAYRTDYCGISDLTDCRIVAEPSDVVSLLTFLRQPQVNRASWAAIFSEPKGTALAFLFRSSNCFLKRFGVFSTWESAGDFLEVPIHASIFEWV